MSPSGFLTFIREVASMKPGRRQRARQTPMNMPKITSRAFQCNHISII